MITEKQYEKMVDRVENREYYPSNDIDYFFQYEDDKFTGFPIKPKKKELKAGKDVYGMIFAPERMKAPDAEKMLLNKKNKTFERFSNAFSAYRTGFNAEFVTFGETEKIDKVSFTEVIDEEGKLVGHVNSKYLKTLMPNKKIDYFIIPEKQYRYHVFAITKDTKLPVGVLLIVYEHGLTAWEE